MTESNRQIDRQIQSAEAAARYLGSARTMIANGDSTLTATVESDSGAVFILEFDALGELSVLALQTADGELYGYDSGSPRYQILAELVRLEGLLSPESVAQETFEGITMEISGDGMFSVLAAGEVSSLPLAVGATEQFRFPYSFGSDSTPLSGYVRRDRSSIFVLGVGEGTFSFFIEPHGSVRVHFDGEGVSIEGNS